MNARSVYKYQLENFRKPILIFYLVIACVIALICLSVRTTLTDSETVMAMTSMFQISGFELNTILYLFVCGLNMFRETFRLSMQNGVTRQKVWSGTVLSFLTVGGGMALIDTGIRLAAIYFIKPLFDISIGGLYESLYGEPGARNIEISTVQSAFEGFLLNICLYTAALAIGYFITIGYYRMNKIAKIIVSIGVPGFFTIILPILIAILSNADPSERYYHAARIALSGSNYDNPFFGMGFGLVISAVFLGLTYLMVRRTPIKD